MGSNSSAQNFSEKTRFSLAEEFLAKASTHTHTKSRYAVTVNVSFDRPATGRVFPWPLYFRALLNILFISRDFAGQFRLKPAQRGAATLVHKRGRAGTKVFSWLRSPFSPRRRAHLPDTWSKAAAMMP